MSQFVSVAPPSLLRSLTDELTFDEDDDDDDAGDDDEKEEFHWHKKGGREGGRGVIKTPKCYGNTIIIPLILIIFA